MVKESLVMHQKVSKYYENDSFLLIFMSSLTGIIVKKCHIQAGFSLSF